MEMTTVKTIAVFAVIFGCFAVLYPKIFHPLLLNVVGLSPSESKTDDMSTGLPPHLRKPNMGQAREVHSSGGGVPEDMVRHMRGGAHPGMRAAAEMQKQTQQGGSGGKGMMTVVLPMYAIGIVIYLVYTLSKVFSGKKKVNAIDERKLRQMERKELSEVRYDSDRKKFIYGEEESDKEDEDFQNFKQNKRQKRDLEKLLYKADKEQISDLEMRELKRRLMETESQMSRILNAMENVSENVGFQDVQNVYPKQSVDDEEDENYPESNDNHHQNKKFTHISRKEPKRKRPTRKATKPKTQDVGIEDVDVPDNFFVGKDMHRNNSSESDDDPQDPGQFSDSNEQNEQHSGCEYQSDYQKDLNLQGEIEEFGTELHCENSSNIQTQEEELDASDEEYIEDSLSDSTEEEVSADESCTSDYSEEADLNGEETQQNKSQNKLPENLSSNTNDTSPEQYTGSDGHIRKRIVGKNNED